MNKLSMIVLLTGIVVLLIGSNYSWGQKKPVRAGNFQARFNEMDTNGDGKISPNEHMEYIKKHAEKSFTRADVNKDGFLSSEELKKTIPKRKKKAQEKSKEQHKRKKQ